MPVIRFRITMLLRVFCVNNIIKRCCVHFSQLLELARDITFMCVPFTVSLLLSGRLLSASWFVLTYSSALVTDEHFRSAAPEESCTACDRARLSHNQSVLLLNLDLVSTTSTVSIQMTLGGHPHHIQPSFVLFDKLVDARMSAAMRQYDFHPTSMVSSYWVILVS